MSRELNLLYEKAVLINGLKVQVRDLSRSDPAACSPESEKLDLAKERLSKSLEEYRQIYHSWQEALPDGRKVLGGDYASICALARANRHMSSAMWTSVGLDSAGQVAEARFAGLGLSDISALAPVSGLLLLDLGENDITDIGPLAGLLKLRHLVLGSNRINDATPISGLVELQTLHLDNNELKDAGPLAGLISLRELRLDCNQLTKIDALAQLSNLTYLAVDYNQIADISALAGLNKLEELWLAGNQLTEVSVLAELNELRSVVLNGNKLGWWSTRKLVGSLKRRGVHVHW